MKPLRTLALSALTALLLHAAAPAALAGGWLGLYPDVPRGVRVGDIIKNSPADLAGLQRGDVITGIDGKDVTTVQEFSLSIFKAAPGSEITLSVSRQGELMTVKAKLESSDGHSASLLYPMPQVRPGMEPPSALPPAVPPPSRLGVRIPPGHTHDFQQRMNAAFSLLEAYERIAQEKNLGDKGRQTGNQIKALLEQAKDHYTNFRMEQGNALTERAYRMTRVAIEQLRGGETLINALNFANKEEEYLYELDRNNAFQILTRQLLAATPVVTEGEGVQQGIQQSIALRGQAEGAALKGDFENGVKLLEQATEEMIKLLRQAGMNIP